VNQMLYHTLKHLMKNVRCDGKEDIHKWKAFPKWMVHRFQPSIVTSKMKCGGIAIRQQVGVDHGCLYAGREAPEFTQLVIGNGTFRALPAVCAGHKDLLRVIANKGGEDRVTLAPDAVTAHYHDSGFTICADRA